MGDQPRFSRRVVFEQFVIKSPAPGDGAEDAYDAENKINFPSSLIWRKSHASELHLLTLVQDIFVLLL